MSIDLVNANALHIPLEDNSVHVCVTSPPYYALRSYSGTATWEGGDAGCDHEAARHKNRFDYPLQEGNIVYQGTNAGSGFSKYDDTCPKCGAIRHDGQLGLEKRADCGAWSRGKQEPYISWHIEDDESVPYIAWRPVGELKLCGECYICQMVAVFREVKRVLRKDGIVFLNIGDSYASAWSCNRRSTIGAEAPLLVERNNRLNGFLKEKDMMLIPQRLALALQADGWWVRSDIIWAKPNPMPESVTDRPTKSHEYIWLLAKSKDYFWDSEAIREPHIDFERGANGTRIGWSDEEREEPGNRRGTALNIDRNGNKRAYNPSGRNARTVWNIATQPYSGAHYATYPEELVLRCLKAATSERGCCPKCGKMWERITEIDYEILRKSKIQDQPKQKNAAQPFGFTVAAVANKITTTLGFRPACACDLPPVPATILDPFAGSGTTLLVAKRMGLNAVGLDLSYQYLRENAWERVGMSQPVMV